MALPTTDPFAMLQSIGGTKQTSSPGDTAALQAVIAQLQGFDPQAQLATIFQQAAGQIPGLQAAYGNAMGARRSGNSAIQNALNALLAQTTVAGQQQVAQQQLDAMKSQVPAAQSIASTTQGTKQTKSTDMSSLAKNLLIMQGLAKLGDTELGKSVFGNVGKVLGVNAPAQAAAAQAMPTATPAAPAAQISQAPQQTFNIMDLLQAAPAQDVTIPADYGMSVAPDMTAFNIMDYLGNDTPAPEMSYAPAEWFQQPDVMSYFGE